MERFLRAVVIFSLLFGTFLCLFENTVIYGGIILIATTIYLGGGVRGLLETWAKQQDNKEEG